MANAASGMAVDDECKLKFLELKSKRTHRFILYKIDDKLNKIVVDKLGGPDESFDAFTSSFPEKDCRYAVYDYDYVTEDNSAVLQQHRRLLQDLVIDHEIPMLILVIKEHLFGRLKELMVQEISFSTFMFLQKTVSVCLEYFASKTPDVSRVRTRMLYASSKDRFKRELDLTHEIQATDASEIEIENFKERANRC